LRFESYWNRFAFDENQTDIGAIPGVDDIEYAQRISCGWRKTCGLSDRKVIDIFGNDTITLMPITVG
jgi:hypothetical protein